MRARSEESVRINENVKLEAIQRLTVEYEL